MFSGERKRISERARESETLDFIIDIWVVRGFVGGTHYCYYLHYMLPSLSRV